MCQTFIHKISSIKFHSNCTDVEKIYEYNSAQYNQILGQFVIMKMYNGSSGSYAYTN